MGIRSQVKELIVVHLGIDESKVIPEASFIDDLGADSLDNIQLVTAFEEAFEITIPVEEEENIKTVQDAIDAIAMAKLSNLIEEK